MSNTLIQIKKSSVTGNTPDAGSLEYGELAINYADGKIFFKDDLNVVRSIYLQNLYETLNVDGTLLIPTSPTDILNLISANGIKVSANTTLDQIIIDETLSPIINIVYDQANAAYDHANTRFSSSGGTISGDVTITGNVAADYLTINNDDVIT